MVLNWLKYSIVILGFSLSLFSQSFSYDFNVSFEGGPPQDYPLCEYDYTLGASCVCDLDNGVIDNCYGQVGLSQGAPPDLAVLSPPIPLSEYGLIRIDLVSDLFPSKLTEEGYLVSVLEDSVRYSFTVNLLLDAEGSIYSVRFDRSLVNSIAYHTAYFQKLDNTGIISTLSSKPFRIPFSDPFTYIDSIDTSEPNVLQYYLDCNNDLTISLDDSLLFYKYLPVDIIPYKINFLLQDYNNDTGFFIDCIYYNYLAKYPYKIDSLIDYHFGSSVYQNLAYFETYVYDTLSANDSMCLPIFVTKNIYIGTPCLPLFPTAFSPNGDGYNDGFRGVYTANPSECPAEMNEVLSIYDRWGNLVFSGTGPTAAWDGRMNGGDSAPIGVYVYVYKARIGEEEQLLKGNLTLLR